MKIALLTDGIYPYVIGGMQKHSYYLAKYFAANSVDVDLYHFSESAAHDINKLDIFSEREKLHINSVVLEFPRQDPFPGHYIRASYRYSEKIFNILKHNLDVDFIYTKGFSGWKLFMEKKKGMQLPPCGVKLHGMNMYDRAYSLRSFAEQIMLRPPAAFCMRYADYVFSYGGKVTDIIRDKAGVPADKIIEVPAGIEPSWLSEASFINNRTVQFVFVGRYDRIKGIEDLMAVLGELLKEGHDFGFHFIGPVPEHLQMKSAAVTYHGTVTSQSEMQGLLRKMDVLVCPSYSEGMPNVVIEAMASGLAVIASDVGAVNIMVSERTGWLIEPGSRNQLRKAILAAIGTGSTGLQVKKIQSLNFVRENLLWEKVILKLLGEITRKIQAK